MGLNRDLKWTCFVRHLFLVSNVLYLNVPLLSPVKFNTIFFTLIFCLLLSFIHHTSSRSVPGLLFTYPIHYNNPSPNLVLIKRYKNKQQMGQVQIKAI